MTLKACPQCGYRYNAPENQTCGKCKGWLGGPVAATAVVAPRRSLIPRSLPEYTCYLAVPIGALLGFPNPIGAAFGLGKPSSAPNMERFSKGLLMGIVIAGVFFVYLIFLLIFNFLFNSLEPVLQTLVGRSFKH